ncbi:MAG: hypothetical protein ACOC1O_05855 [bacterium]
MEFEIIDIIQQKQRFQVEIELTATRERKKFGYPLGEGWEIEINGEPRFLKNIKEKLRREKESMDTGLDTSKFEKLKKKKIKTD